MSILIKKTARNYWLSTECSGGLWGNNCENHCTCTFDFTCNKINGKCVIFGFENSVGTFLTFGVFLIVAVVVISVTLTSMYWELRCKLLMDHRYERTQLLSSDEILKEETVGQKLNEFQEIESVEGKIQEKVRFLALVFIFFQKSK